VILGRTELVLGDLPSDNPCVKAHEVNEAETRSIAGIVGELLRLPRQDNTVVLLPVYIHDVTATALPPLDPPDVRLVSQGLTVTPVSGLSVTHFQASSEVVVLPSSTAPCSRRRATAGPSIDHSWSGETNLEPRRVGHP